MLQNWRDKYSNPFPPHGYVRQNPGIELKEHCRVIDGITCQFLGLIIDSGVLDDTDHTSEFTPHTSEEHEIVEVPVEKKAAHVFDFEEDSPSDVPKVQSKPASVNKDAPFSKEKKGGKIAKNRANVCHSSEENADSVYYSQKKRIRTSDTDDSDYYDKKKLKSDPHYPLKLAEEAAKKF